ncbi:DNA-directed RNA polymerase I subunit RPA2 [Caerostris extrusa]|uniref:DNA-directed RNA polymerase subunit beta n=1 Tax=Caerostris extrusa TaxID=172846 RepID=A0AAV4N152_CAEEX|nr:DNA-directed RNA polymerase I subunit RPA2 [Caerostris extrusa]
MAESSKKPYLKEVSRIYLDSFNYVLQEGLEKAILDFDPVFTKTDVNVKISIDGVEWKEFTYAMDTRKHIRPVLPSEARERGATYYAELRIKLRFETDTKVAFSSRTFFVPLMVKSKLLFLNEMEDKELLEKREDLNDPGGYFIVDGSERLFRTFVIPRRNYPLGILNEKWKMLKKGYSEYGILISCQKDNHSISDVSLHYVNHTKDTNHVSVEEIFFIQYSFGETSASNCEVTDHILKSSVFIHLNNNEEKFQLFWPGKKCTNHASSLTPIVKTIIATGNLSRNHGLMSQTGFLCPAQTPEGENSGLYNHLALGMSDSELRFTNSSTSLLYKLGVLPFYDPLTYSCYEKTSVFLDGKIVGWIGLKCIPSFLGHLKNFRSTKKHVPEHTEIVYIPENNPQILFPGIFIFSTPCRLIRQVENVQTKNLEFLGCFEQLFTSVALCGEDVKKWNLEYTEVNSSNVLVYADYNWDDNPIGTNIFIAVISYSGFDMEDAVVLNKAAVQRGLMRDSIYKTVTYCLEDFAKELNCTVNELTFKRDLTNSSTSLYLDEDGLPYIGIFVKKGDPVLSVFNKKGDKSIIKTYNARSPAYIEAAKFMGISASSVDKRLPTERHKIGITYRMMRIPETGDKFSNRHGQKGVCGSLVSPENLPFTADGLIPDILFNPHGLPSRMSVGMLLEILASNAAAEKCKKIKVVPFEFSEEKNAVEEFGNILKEAGMDFLCGYVYSYRLHHVVEDKYQVVSLAENYDPKTMQPLNLYKAGAIRFGEMEKDAILSHGAMSLTLDRLLLNSDKCNAFVCGECESLLFPVIQPLNHFELPEDIKAFIKAELESSPLKDLRRVNYSENKYCHLCQKDSTYGVRIPYALVYLVAELATFNIKVNFSVN